MKFHIGTSGYGYKEWKGKFYPEKIMPGEMLRYYAGHLSAVEINNTFYHMPTVALITSWSGQVPVNFIFAFKASRVITHQKHLNNVGLEMQYLFRTLSILHGKMGAVLFQFPASFRADAAALDEFLTLIPPQTLCSFEFRNRTWQTDHIFNLLGGKGCSFCITDRDEHPMTDIISTAPWGYLRLRRSNYSDADLASWLHKIVSQKWKQVFVFFKHEDMGKGPELAMRFRRIAEIDQPAVK